MYTELTASMMCANFGNLEKEVKELEVAGIDSFHIDIMDGRYVPNFAMSLNDMRYIRSATDKPLDVHLMIEHPNTHINLFLNALKEGDTVYIHPEAEYHPSTTLQKIIDAGLVPGIAINPGTSIETVMEMLQIVDKVLVMSVIRVMLVRCIFHMLARKLRDFLSFVKKCTLRCTGMVHVVRIR